MTRGRGSAGVVGRAKGGREVIAGVGEELKEKTTVVVVKPQTPARISARPLIRLSLREMRVGLVVRAHPLADPVKNVGYLAIRVLSS
jgi:hypothetical protein